LKPGGPFGGSCLPKDLRALLYQGKGKDLDLPLLSSILASNETHLRRIVDTIRETGKRKIGLVGLSFKQGTDDLRESPMVSLAETLIGKGYDLTIYDREVKYANLIGSNRSYVNEHIPHLVRLLTDNFAELLQKSEVIIFFQKPDVDLNKFQPVFANPGKIVIDLVGVEQEIPSVKYRGICW